MRTTKILDYHIVSLHNNFHASSEYFAMSSLAELTGTLRRKDDEKSAVMAALKSLLDLQNSRSVAGRLTLSITECLSDDLKFDFVVHPEASFVAVGSSDMNNKVFMFQHHEEFRPYISPQGVRQEVEIFLRSREVAVEIMFLVKGAEYKAMWEVQNVPINDVLSMMVECTCVANGAKCDVRIKVSIFNCISLKDFLTL